MARLRITKIKSTIDRPYDQKHTMRLLKLNKIGQWHDLDDTPAVRGMVRKIIHLVKVEPLD